MNEPLTIERRYVGPQRKGYQAYHEKLRNWHEFRAYTTPESLKTAIYALRVKGKHWEYRVKGMKDVN